MYEFYAALKLLISLDHVKSNPMPLLLFTFIEFIETCGILSYRGLSQTTYHDLTLVFHGHSSLLITLFLKVLSFSLTQQNKLTYSLIIL